MFNNTKWNQQLLNWCYLTCVILWLLFVLTVETFEEERLPRNYTRDEFDVNTATDDDIKTRLVTFGVHYSLKSVLEELSLPQNKEDESVHILVGKYMELEKRALLPLPLAKYRHPIISIDGFFTHGRTKIAKMVATALYGRRFLLPTRHMARLRMYLRPDIKKHYYSLSKYTGALLAKCYCRSAPVILERYWHDQATYVLAKTFPDLIPENSSIYDFPKDLLVPDMMFFVNGALNQQIHNETTAVIHEHNVLAKKIAIIFKRMKNPALIEISPPDLPKPMTKKILEVVDSMKHNFLPKPLRKPLWHS